MQNTNTPSEEKGLKKCPHCQKEVDPKATKCPHCHSDMRNWFRRHPIWTLLLVLIFVPIIISQAIAKPVPVVTPAEHIASAKESSAESFSRSYVKGMLKAPSTAKPNYFPSVTADPKDPNLFHILSHVDSENSYGAMIRSVWSMDMRYTGSDTKEEIDNGDNWEIVSFEFDGKKLK